MPTTRKYAVNYYYKYTFFGDLPARNQIYNLIELQIGNENLPENIRRYHLENLRDSFKTHHAIRNGPHSMSFVGGCSRVIHLDPAIFQSQYYDIDLEEKGIYLPTSTFHSLIQISMRPIPERRE
ncbi:U6 putative protein [Bangoran virus]|uniref:U6 putative protein n=1 Tax=Bangoran virus TaxID=864693 RepID=UPI0024820694|nr:U6 putative protein [Bangoran virus]UAX43323.1 U6 putative protein [Bangoran virus]